MKLWIQIILILSIIHIGYSQEEAAVEEELTEEQISQLIDSIESTINYQYGTISLVDGHATIDVPEGFKFIDGEQAAYVLTDLWGNPPSDELPEGMLVPKERGVITDNFTYAIEITYSDDGYIDDEDAKEIDYYDLLEQMQDDSKEENEYRKQEGYQTVDIVGWASTPYYDAETKKLHWAKELQFEGSEKNTLNYNIRVLGRKGYLNLNAIGDMDIYSQVKSGAPDVLDAVQFSEGYAYGDFKPGVDKVAAYGIAGLIAGKILLKAGLLAKFGFMLLKFWKFIAIGIFALFPFLRRFFKKGGDKSSTQKDTEEFS